MGPKYHNEYYDDFGNIHRWELWDDNLAPSSESQEVQSSLPGFRLEVGSRGAKVYDPVLRSTGTAFWRITSAGELAVLESIAQDQEGRYYLKYLKRGELEWWGPVVVDLIKIPNQAIEEGLEVQLQARDGLQVLKEKKSAVSYVSAFHLLFQLLRSTDTGSLKADTDEFLRTSIRFFETSMTYATTQNPFARWTVEADNTFKDPEKTEWFDHYTVLERILLAFSAQLVLSGGCWRIMHHSDKADGIVREHIYRRNYSPGGSDFQNESGIISAGVNDALTTTEGNPQYVEFLGPSCSHGYMPKLKRAERKVKFDGGTVIWKRANFITSTEFLTASVTELSSGDSFIRLAATIQVEITSGVSSWQSVARQYVVRIKLVGASTWYFGPSGWITAAVANTVQTTFSTIYPAQNSFYTDQVNIDTSDIPGSGTLYLEIDLDFVAASGNQQVPSQITVNTFKALQISVEHLPEDLTQLRDRLVYAEDASSTSSAVETLPDAFIIDGGGSTNNTKIRIWTGSQWQDSALWNFENSGTNRTLIALQLEELLRLYSQPRQRHDVVMNGSLSPHELVLWDSRRLAFMYYSYETGNGLIQAELLELNRITDDFTIGEITDVPQQVTPAAIAGQALKFNLPPGLPITYTTSTLSPGTSSGVNIQALGFDGPMDGQKLIIVNLQTLQAEEVEIDADVDSATTDLSFTEIELSGYYPQGSLIMIQGQELSNMLVRRASGQIAGLTLAAAKIGASTEAIEIDTTSGDARLDGQLALPNLQTSGEAAVGEVYQDGEGFLKLKQAP